MSNVIQLKERGNGRKSMPLPAGASAQIMIFTGVRIERLTDDMIANEPPASRRLPARHNQAIAEELE